MLRPCAILASLQNYSRWLKWLKLCKTSPLKRARVSTWRRGITVILLYKLETITMIVIDYKASAVKIIGFITYGKGNSLISIKCDCHMDCICVQYYDNINPISYGGVLRVPPPCGVGDCSKIYLYINLKVLDYSYISKTKFLKKFFKIYLSNTVPE